MESLLRRKSHAKLDKTSRKGQGSLMETLLIIFLSVAIVAVAFQIPRIIGRRDVTIEFDPSYISGIYGIDIFHSAPVSNSTPIPGFIQEFQFFKRVIVIRPCKEVNTVFQP